MLIECICPDSRAPEERHVVCYLVAMKLMMEGQNGQSIGLTVVPWRFLLICGYIPQDPACENSILHKSIMRKMSHTFRNQSVGNSSIALIV